MKYKLLIIIALVAVVFITVLGISKEDEDTNIWKMMKLVNNVSVETYRNYVDPIDLKKFTEAGISGMLKTLDPHTQFFKKRQYDNLKVSTQGKFEGIGVVIGIRNDVLTVISPIEGTPGYRAGLQAGDQIVKIEGKSTKGITMDGAVDKLRGPRGSLVTITIKRMGEPKLIDYDITRDVIEIKSVPYYGLLENNIGYVRLSRFSEESGRELRDAIDELNEMDIDGLILDLRNNPGGLLAQAVEVSGAFLPADNLVVYTKGKSTFQDKEFNTRMDGLFKDKPLLVLVNNGSASASEIVAGAIQDHDRGVVMGQKTFGKGLVQSLIPVDDGQALKITTAKYYIPSGRCIQKEDYLNKSSSSIISEYSSTEEDEEYTDEYEEEIDEDTISISDSDTTGLPVYYTDNGRKVYGGGGIFPDITYEPEKLNRLDIELERKGMFFEFAVDYTVEHKDIPTDFEVDDIILSDFKNLLKEKDFSYQTRAEEELEKIVELSEENKYSDSTNYAIDQLQARLEHEKERDFDKSLEYIRNGIKREIVAKLWGTEKRYELVTVKTDKELQRALEIMSDKEMFNSYLVAP
ncbi:S41 family peptidase [bacterium]|nr:S41 family peptidase [bacterium]